MRTPLRGLTHRKKVVSDDRDRRTDGTTSNRLAFVCSTGNGIDCDDDIGDDRPRDRLNFEAPEGTDRAEEAGLINGPDVVLFGRSGSCELRGSSRPEPVASRTGCRPTRLAVGDLQALRQADRLWAG